MKNSTKLNTHIGFIEVMLGELQKQEIVVKESMLEKF